jgi:3D (Asp-Asp-Asp) domain-containing protein
VGKSVFLSISILMILVALVFLVLTISSFKTALPTETPDRDLDRIELQIDYLRQRVDRIGRRIDELEARLQDLQDGLEDLLETFDMAETYTLTAYAPLDPKAVHGLDYIGDPTITASGDKPIPGQTVAADKSIPFGTKVWIEGVGVRTVNDRGGAIKRGRLDLCMATKSEAIHFGRQKRKVIILKDGKK